METIKEEKKADLEQLLNSLIEKGWDVFGHKDRINAEKCNYIEGNYYNFDNHNISISLRELVAKESGLWQFVCENGMVKKEGGYRAKRRHLHGWEHDEDVYHDISYTKNDYEYYIIESSLKDESELEDFLLNSIKLD